MGLQQFERRLERLVEGAFARAFRSGLQPVELGRRLTREMDLGRIVGVRGTIAPNRYAFLLAPADLERFEPIQDSLVRELTDAAREHARREGYIFMGGVEVVLEPDPSQTTGTFNVDVETSEGGAPGPRGSLVLPNGDRVSVGPDAVTIGRTPDCELQLSDQSVSRRHAQLRVEGDQVIVMDLESRNGTKVNGSGVTEKVLNHGDEVRVGDTVLRYEAN